MFFKSDYFIPLNIVKKTLLIALVCFLFVSCKKEKTPQEQSSHANAPLPCTAHPATPISNPDMLACKFKTGSFWVFRDSLSGATDTLFVQNLTRTSGYSYSNPGSPCDSLEIFVVSAITKNEPAEPIKRMQYWIYENAILLSNDYYSPGANPLPFLYTPSAQGSGFTIQDSLFIYDRYYHKVGRSEVFEFTTTKRGENPTTLFSKSLRIYFSLEFGPLQLDVYDRLTKQLVERRQVIARTILR